MRRGPLVAAAAALAMAAGTTGGCGGSSSATTTTTPAPAPAPAPAPQASVPTTPGVTAPPSEVAIEDRLPPSGALAGLRTGSVRVVDDPRAFVDALYRAGDPTKPAAAARLAAAGYTGGVLRDQVGTNPAEGLALFRSYAIALRDEAAARAEVDAAAKEARESTTDPTREVDPAGIPGARGLRVDVEQDGLRGAVVLVTFPAGRYVYGLQGVSVDDASLPQDEIVGAARDLYERVTAAP